ncbi:MAG: murein L,D-transpeptidase catalytic domain family protein [Lysobacterales bacterium]
MRALFRLLLALALLAPTLAAARPTLEQRLARLAPDLNREVLALALQARQCAGAARGERLAIIDYSRPSTERRLWVFDLRRPRLLYREYVAHGRGSGDNYATQFSNVSGSYQSSLGLFRTADTYQGGNGYTLRLDGMDPGFNDLARARAIVMHGAAYVDPHLAQTQGRLGRSLGCPALRPQIAREIIDTLRDGQWLFAYYPDATWLKRAASLSCTSTHTRMAVNAVP